MTLRFFCAGIVPRAICGFALLACAAPALAAQPFPSFRDLLADKAPYALDDNGCVAPHDGTGIGLKIDLDFIREHPLIEGPCYV